MSEESKATTSRNGLLRVSQEGIIIWGTRGAHALLGKAPGTLVGSRWASTFDDDEKKREVPETLLRRCEEQGDAFFERALPSPWGRLQSQLEKDDEGFVEYLAPAPTLELFDEALVALEHAERLQKISAALAAALSIPEVVDVFVKHAVPAFGGNSGAFALLSRDGGSLEFVEGRLSARRVPEKYRRIPLADNDMTRAWLSGHPVWVKDTTRAHAPSGPEGDPSSEQGRIAFVPMMLGEERVGMLVFEAQGKERLNLARELFAETLAQTFAHTVARARLAEEERYMQQRIADSEKRLREITSAVPLFVWVHDTEGRLAWINEKRVMGFFGVKAEVFMAAPTDFMHEDDVQLRNDAIAQAIASGKGYEIEIRLRRQDGVYRWHLVRAEASRDEDGRIACWYGSSTDIDEQKRVREALRTNEERLRLALQVGRMIAWEYSPSADLLKATENLDGIGLRPVGARPLMDVAADVYPEDREPTEKLLRKALESGQDFEATFRRRFADGSWRWLASRAKCVVDQNGRVTGLIGVSRDVDDERKWVLRLLASEEMFRTVIDHLPGLAWTTTPDGVTDFRNAAFFEYTGLVRGSEEDNDLRVYEHLHPDEKDRVVNNLLESYRTLVPWEMEYRLRRHDGVYHWHLGRTVPVFDADKKLLRWVGTAIDIDDQKRVLAEREELLLRTQEAVRGREVFLAVAAHELRTPLTPLLLHVDTLLRQSRSGGTLSAERVQRGLEVASRQMHRLQLLVEALLDVSRIASGRLEMKEATIDTVQLVREVLERHRHELQLETLSLQLPDELYAHIDRLRFEQIVTNLLTNALKYGHGTPICIELERRGDRLRFSVADSGIGIAPEDHERIFERFERAGAALPQGGLGLGLWIVRQIVRAMGGAISVSSSLGHGSTFSVELPLNLDKVSTP